MGCSAIVRDGRDREDPFPESRSLKDFGVIVRAELQFTEATFEVTGEFFSLLLGILGGGLVGGS